MKNFNLNWSMVGNQKNENGVINLSTKVPIWVGEIFNKICEQRGVTTFQLLKWLVYSVVKAARGEHELTDDMRRLLNILELDSGWQNAFNLCSHAAKNDIAQVIVILEQNGKKGFGLTMIDKPFMSEARQTDCIDDILERVIEVGFPGIYKMLRRIAIDMDCQSFAELVMLMADAQDVINLNEQNKAEMTADNDFVEYGNNKPLQPWKQPYKTKKHLTPDSLARLQKTKSEGLEDKLGFRPHGGEW